MHSSSPCHGWLVLSFKFLKLLKLEFGACHSPNGRVREHVYLAQQRHKHQQCNNESPIRTAEEQWCMEMVLLLMLLLMLGAWCMATRNLIHIAECTARVLLRLVTTGRGIGLKILYNMEREAHIQFSLCQKSLDLITEFTVARVVSTIYNRIPDDHTSSSHRPRIWNFELISAPLFSYRLETIFRTARKAQSPKYFHERDNA